MAEKEKEPAGSYVAQNADTRSGNTAKASSTLQQLSAYSKQSRFLTWGHMIE